MDTPTLMILATLILLSLGITFSAFTLYCEKEFPGEPNTTFSIPTSIFLIFIYLAAALLFGAYITELISKQFYAIPTIIGTLAIILQKNEGSKAYNVGLTITKVLSCLIMTSSILILSKDLF